MLWFINSYCGKNQVARSIDRASYGYSAIGSNLFEAIENFKERHDSAWSGYIVEPGEKAHWLNFTVKDSGEYYGRYEFIKEEE